jgi:hypothetical protein
LSCGGIKKAKVGKDDNLIKIGNGSLSVDGYINRKQQFVTFCWKKGIFCGKN